ncbi:MAG: response regulator [Saprospiraceae bacterium]
MNRKIKLLLVDDHQIVIDGLKLLLEVHPNFEIIGSANNGKLALEMIKILQPDIVLMDIDMPIMNGIIAAQKSIGLFPKVKIIILSLHFEKPIIQKMLELGVSGYLLKNADYKEVIQAIEIVEKGKQYFSSEVTTALLSKTNLNFSPQKNENSAGKLALLSEREIEILKLLAEGFSSKEISEQLFLSARTVETHRFNLMKKLEIKKLAHLIRFAVRCGM